MMLCDFWNDGLVGRSILFGIPTLFILLIVGIVADAQRWDAFKTAHNCRIVSRMSGDIVTTVAPIIGGQGGVAIGVSSTPDKTGWLCDDGVTYWR